MRISIKGQQSDLSVNTITVTRNRLEPANVYLLRCFNCGNAINQIQGDIWALSPGHIPTREVTTINRCSKCHENYTFESFESFGRVTPDINLILVARPKVATFHCLRCQQPIVQYSLIGAVVLPQFSPLLLPADFECFSCQTGYYLNDLVEADNSVQYS